MQGRENIETPALNFIVDCRNLKFEKRIVNGEIVRVGIEFIFFFILFCFVPKRN